MIEWYRLTSLKYMWKGQVWTITVDIDNIYNKSNYGYSSISSILSPIFGAFLVKVILKKRASILSRFLDAFSFEWTIV